MSDFVHLHCHTDYSLLDGAAKIKGLAEKAHQCGMRAVAITDHGNMFGAIEFYKKCKSSNVKPIIGMEGYIAVDSRFDRTSGGNALKYHHLILLAKNLEGYHNLMRLSSIGYLEGFYYRPRFDKETLAKYSKGLVVTSACLQGEVAYHLSRDNLQTAEEAVRWYKDLLGEDYYLEVQNHGIPEQEKSNKEILRLAKKYEVKVVATNDLHYLNHDDHFAHDVLLCVGTASNLKDPNRFKFDGDHFYFKTIHEMETLFKTFPEALSSTIEVAEKCNVEIDFNQRFLPHFEPPTGEEPGKYFRRLCQEGLAKRYKEHTPALQDRLNYEMDVIEQMGFASYFLIVQDFVRFAKDRGIPVGPGRGSAAGSVVAYVLTITDVDPLKYDLLFERFLNSERISMPDIDIDFSHEGRDAVIQYVTERYGKERVAQIITFGTLAARGVIRDVARVLEIPLKEVDKITKMIPGKPGTTLEKALEEEPDLKEYLKQGDDSIQKLFDISKRLEGLSRHASTHAAGVVIGSKPLMDIVPLYKVGDEITTQYTMTVLEELGLLKMDFLGLKTLSIIDRAVKLIESTKKIKLDILEIPLDDPKTYQLLSKGDTKGVFQLESSGMRDVLTRLKPDRFDDIIALLALYRPGPLGSGMVDAYIRRKHGEEELSYAHPLLEPVLKESNGVILYQEQVMRIANVLSLFSLNEADNLRKAMGKKKPEILAKFRKKFIDGGTKNGVDEKISAQVFDLIEFFAGYGFNKCIAGSTQIMDAETGEWTTVKDLFQRRHPFKIHALGADYKLNIRKVEDVLWNGKKMVYELRTAQGKTIKATETHRFRTLDGWKALGDLKPGDRIASPRRIECKTKKSWPQHEIIALASLLAEGNTYHPSSLYFFSEKRANGAIRSGLYRWAQKQGILGKKATAKAVPSGLFELCDEDIALFLGRLWTGDGFIANETNHTPFYATSSRQLARDVQTLLLRLGIMSGIHEKKFRYRGGKRTGYTVHLVGEDSIAQFARIVLPHCVDCHEKAKQLCKYLAATNRDRASKDTIPAEVREWVDEERQSAGLTWRNLEELSGVSIRMLCTSDSSKKRGFRRSTIHRLARFFASKRLQNISNSDVFWDTVHSIEPSGIEDTYDLTVEEDHSFVANGLIVHNSHSTAYAFITYQTAYLKSTYPIEYMAALLTCEMGVPDKIVEYVEEARQMGIEIVPPNIQDCASEFTVKKKKIYYGLSAIKGAGTKAIDSIVEARKSLGKFQSLFHLCENIDLRVCNKGVMESLIKSGAMDSLKAKRSQMLQVLDQALKMGNKHQKDLKSGQISLFGGVEAQPGEGGSSGDHLYPEIDELSSKEKLSMEKEVLGFYLSGHPIDKYKKIIEQYSHFSLAGMKTAANEKNVLVGGMLSHIKKIRDKKGNNMAFITLEDQESMVEGVVFASIYEKVTPLLEEDLVVFLKGKVSYKNETPSIMVDEILSPEQIDLKFAESITISLEANGTNLPDLLEIRDVVMRHSGSQSLYLDFTSPEGTVALLLVDRNYRVRINPRLIADLEALPYIKKISFNKEHRGKILSIPKGSVM